MRTFIVSLLAMLLSCTLSGCTAKVVNAFNNTGELLLVAPGQAPREIPKESNLYHWLSGWLETHQDNWASSPASYVPGFLVKGRGFHLNFNEDFVVVNYAGNKGRYRQFVRYLAPEDYADFSRMASGE